ncbi:MAG: universal stress protein [Burkholderiales bacterium]|nr:universal stress protein [Burkholderiales bacterium]
MTDKKRIVVATDFSPRAGMAIERAARMARAWGAELSLLHVMGRLPLEAIRRILIEHPLAVEQRLVDAARNDLGGMAAGIRARHGISAAFHVGIGATRDEVAAYAQSTGCDLVVIGAHGENFLQELLLGTTAQKIVRQGRGPFLIVKREPLEDYSRVLVPVDFSPTSRHALETALRFFPAADIRLLHVYEVPFESKMRYSGVSEDVFRHYQDLARREAEAGMADFLRSLPENGRALSGSVRHGYAPAVILQCARDFDADLIAIGGQGRSELSYMLLGSVAMHVIHESGGDVLVVKMTAGQ